MRKILPGVEEDHSRPDEMAVFYSPDSLFAESFRFLRSKITRPFADNLPRSILISSALMGEGKTLISSNLAVCISQSPDQHALLVDADLRNPSAHRIFGIPQFEPGLAEYLAGKAALPALLKKTPIDKLKFLPAGNSAFGPAEMLSSNKMMELIRELTDRYRDRFIIIDSAPLALAPETSVIADAVDAILLVVLHGKTSRYAVKQVLRKIKKEKLIGIVYNSYDEPSKLYDRYGYYRYGYGKNTKKK